MPKILDNARACLKAAVKLSEEYGLPFATDIIELPNNKELTYHPATTSKWNCLARYKYSPNIYVKIGWDDIYELFESDSYTDNWNSSNC